MRISLVGTVHVESGRANVAELQAILVRLQPDVIFAEIPSADLADYLDCSRGRLESSAVVRYRAAGSQDEWTMVDLTCVAVDDGTAARPDAAPHLHGDLTTRLQDRTRLTFRWKGQR